MPSTCSGSKRRSRRLARCGVIALAILVACSADRPASAPVSTRRARADGSGALDVGLKLAPFAARRILPELPGPVGEVSDKAYKYWDRIEFLLDALEDYERCVVDGGGEDLCFAQEVFWPGICFFGVEALGDIAPGWDLLMPALEPVCLGEPTLKCCRYNGIEQYPNCHTAFNARDPINCEGNPYGGVSFGPCLATNRFEGDIGCLCNYLPDCPIAGVVEIAGAREWRFNQLAVSIAKQASQTFDEDLAAYAAFVGTKAHFQVVSELAPFAKQDGVNPDYPNAGVSYRMDDGNPEARYLRGLVTLAVRRVLAGIPNVVDRWNFVYGRLWTDEEIAAYLAAYPDADAILERWLGAEGMKLLRAAQPRLYRLLVVPLAGEAPQPDAPLAQGGAELGNAPTDYALNATATDSAVTLHPTFVDPDAASNPDGIYGVKVDWGDGRVEGHVYLRDAPETQVLEHAYAVPGTYTIRSWVVNASGLRATRNEEITVVQGTGAVGAPSISAIGLDLGGSISVASGYGSIANPGIFAIDVAAIDGQDVVRFVGRYWVKPPVPSGMGSGAFTFNFDFGAPLPFLGETDVTAIRLSLAHVNEAYVGTKLTLSSVSLTRHASPGEGAVTDTYPLSNADVRVYPTGATTPLAPLLDVETGKLVIPDQDAEVVIAIPANVTPAPQTAYGCRPTYGTAPAAMVTADGGCRDLATGLVWSLQSAQKLSWHDTVWDSALAGNVAPDASDYGRINDYPGQYPVTGPDASPVNYCHSLVQGGYDDWRVPTEAELATVVGAGRAVDYFPQGAAGSAWTSSSSDATYAITRNLADGSRGYGVKTAASARALCVRSDPPPAMHVCKVPSGGGTTFVSDRGGCLDTRAGGLVWSKASVVPRTWDQAVWGSELGGNAQPDENDAGALSDYADGTVPAGPDASLENYCHALDEGGFGDWRLPTSAELLAASGTSLAASYFAFETGEAFHSSSSWDATNAIAKSLKDGSTSYSSKHTRLARVVCVRRPFAPDPAALPGAPGTPTFSSVSATSLRVSWPAAANATSYKVERAADAGGAPGAWLQFAAGVTATYVSDSSRAGNTVYWYRVRGANAAGDGPRSGQSSVLTPPGTPGTPTFSGVGPYSVTVSWTAPANGAASYKVERACSGGSWAQVASGLTAPTVTDATVAANVTCSYRVRATNVAGDGAYSATATVTTAIDPSMAVPAAPGTPTFTSVSSTYLYVNWAAASGAVSYKVERAPDAGDVAGAWTQVATGVKTLNSFDSGRTGNTPYWYRVRATNGGGDGPYSAGSRVLMLPNTPAAPTFSAVAATTLTVGWVAPAGGAASYDVDRAPASSGPWAQIASGVAALSYADSGLTASTAYFYRVRATNAEGKDGGSSSASPVTTLTGP